MADSKAFFPPHGSTQLEICFSTQDSTPWMRRQYHSNACTNLLSSDPLGWPPCFSFGVTLTEVIPNNIQYQTQSTTFAWMFLMHHGWPMNVASNCSGRKRCIAINMQSDFGEILHYKNFLTTKIHCVVILCMSIMNINKWLFLCRLLLELLITARCCYNQPSVVQLQSIC